MMGPEPKKAISLAELEVDHPIIRESITSNEY